MLIQRKLLAVAEPELFKRDPLNLLTIFADCQAHGVQLSGSAYQLVRDNVSLIDDRARSDPRFGASLMRILDGRQRVAETLESMHRSGVLGALIMRVAMILAGAVGHIGSGAEYLMHTVAHLEELGLRDRLLWRLQALVAKELAGVSALQTPARL